MFVGGVPDFDTYPSGIETPNAQGPMDHRKKGGGWSCGGSYVENYLGSPPTLGWGKIKKKRKLKFRYNFLCVPDVGQEPHILLFAK